MEKEIFKRLEKNLGKNWSCTCGSTFEVEWVEVVSKGKNNFLAHYLCQVCGREQVFTLAREQEKTKIVLDLPTTPLSSDDILDIHKELASIKAKSIKQLIKNHQTNTLLPKDKNNPRS